MLDTRRELERRGFEVTYLEVGSDGLIYLDTLAASTGQHASSPSLPLRSCPPAPTPRRKRKMEVRGPWHDALGTLDFQERSLRRALSVRDIIVLVIGVLVDSEPRGHFAGRSSAPPYARVSRGRARQSPSRSQAPGSWLVACDRRFPATSPGPPCASLAGGLSAFSPASQPARRWQDRSARARTGPGQMPTRTAADSVSIWRVGRDAPSSDRSCSERQRR